MYIYLLVNRVNWKCYIGQTKRDFRSRWRDHKARAKTPCCVISKAIKKYGWENFDKYVLQTCESKNELDLAEQGWIQRLGTTAPNGYNIALGGNGSGAVSEEIREKIAASKRGKPRDEATRKKLAESRVGKVGEDAANLKLNWEKVREIRAAYKGGETGASLAVKYKVTPSQISYIVLGKSWPDPLYVPLKKQTSIDPEIVRTIRNSDESHKTLAARFGIGLSSVRQIRCGQTYQWVI